MKKEFERMQADLFLVASGNVVVQTREPYRIRKEIIETTNFVPEGFLVGCLLNEKRNAVTDEGRATLSGGERAMADTICSEIIGSIRIRLDSSLKDPGLRYKLDEDNGGDKDDWDEEDEDWEDEEDEDWDDDEEEWDEDEDWDEDDDDEDDDEDFDEEEEQK